ncbi:hypothetical protein VP01_2471g1 [Puccinia sorghi]|uniref:Uncharacterized protein n=1 Tax=Puccinia sorghi TaxID=27349 RepID=A0A0L6V5W3_9BASI|nr:hypothetical protein VP01_2471g1 [Puccinia sorghi]
MSHRIKFHRGQYIFKTLLIGILFTVSQNLYLSLMLSPHHSKELSSIPTQVHCKIIGFLEAIFDIKRKKNQTFIFTCLSLIWGYFTKWMKKPVKNTPKCISHSSHDDLTNSLRMNLIGLIQFPAFKESLFPLFGTIPPQIYIHYEESGSRVVTCSFPLELNNKCEVFYTWYTTFCGIEPIVVLWLKTFQDCDWILLSLNLKLDRVLKGIKRMDNRLMKPNMLTGIVLASKVILVSLFYYKYWISSEYIGFYPSFLPLYKLLFFIFTFLLWSIFFLSSHWNCWKCDCLLLDLLFLFFNLFTHLSQTPFMLYQLNNLFTTTTQPLVSSSFNLFPRRVKGIISSSYPSPQSTIKISSGTTPISLLDWEIHRVQNPPGFLIFSHNLASHMHIAYNFPSILFIIPLFITFYEPPIFIHFSSSVSFYFFPLIWVREHSIPPNLHLGWKMPNLHLCWQ